MTQYEVTISSKGQLVLPKELRDKFRLNSGSKVKIIADGEQIILQPRTVLDELQHIIHDSITKDGKIVNEWTVKEYQVKVKKALDHLVAEADLTIAKKNR